jgi:hypothetical protein
MSGMIIAVDPGTTQSAFVQWDGQKVQEAGILDNELFRIFLRGRSLPFRIAVEMVACYGMAVGREVFETCLQVGRIQEIACVRSIPCRLVYRQEVKLHHCHSNRAKDSNIRQALVDKYGEPGTKKEPGRTYGLKSHLWSAFAIATYLTETETTAP